MNRIASLVAAAAMICPQFARGDIILSFSPDGSNTSFNVVVGQDITIPIYIVERAQAPFTNILSTDGLVNAGVRVDYANSSPFAGSAVAGTLTQPAWFSVGAPYPIVVNNGDGLGGRIEISGGTVGAAAMTTGSPPAILFGGLTFHGSTVGQIISLSTSNTHPASYAEFVTGGLNPVNLEHEPYGNIFWFGGNPMNGAISYTTTITVVPEPIFGLGLALPAAVLACWRKYRRHGPRSVD